MEWSWHMFLALLLLLLLLLSNLFMLEIREICDQGSGADKGKYEAGVGKNNRMYTEGRNSSLSCWTGITINLFLN